MTIAKRLTLMIAAAAAALTARCQPFDMAGSELAQILGADAQSRHSA